MLNVITDGELVSNDVADHRPGPQSGLISGGLRAGLDDADKFLELLDAQSRRGARSLLVEQTIESLGVVPLQPSIDRCAGHIELGAHRDNGLAVDVAQDCSAPSPECEIAAPLGLTEQYAESLPGRPRPQLRTDCLALFRSRHDLLERDRLTMILSDRDVKFLAHLPGEIV